MADIRVNQLPDIAAIAAGDILHILDISSTDDVDSQTTVDAIADWIIANKSVRITGISDVPGLQAALDGKADIVHTHTVAQVIGLQADLDNKTDISQAQIIGRNIILNGNSINVPSTIGGLQDDRIPSTVVIGDYLQFETTGGGINNISGDDLKGNLNINLVDNTSDANKPISTATQSALDIKVGQAAFNTAFSNIDTTVYNLNQEVDLNTAAIGLNTAKISYPTSASTKLATIETGADVTDTTNVWSSLGISGSGSTGLFLTQRGVFAAGGSGGGSADSVDRQPGGFTTAPIKFWSGTKSQYETLSAAGEVANDILYNITDTESAIAVTKTAVDEAIGASSGGTATLFYNQQGNFVTPAGGGGGADGLSITDSVNLNLLDGTTVLSTVTLPSTSGTTVIAGTTNQIINTVSGDTNTLSLAPAITSAITANTAKTGISTAQANAITTNTAKTGITTAQASAITANTAKQSVAGLTQVGGAIIASDSVLYYDGTVPRRKVFSSVPLSIMNNDSGFITGITKANVDTAIGSGANDTDYYASDKTWKTIPTGNVGTVTEVTGTSPITVSNRTTTPVIGFNFGVVNTFIAAQLFGTIRANVVTGVGDSNTLLDLSVPDTLTLTAGAVDFIDCIEAGIDTLVVNSGRVDMDVDFRKNSSGSWLNYNAGTDTITLSATTFSGFPTGGTSTTVLGTANQVVVNTSGNTATVSLATAITGAITANTAKTGISTAQATAITNNTAKVGITTAQATAITNNTAKVGITTAQATAITNNTAKTGITTAQASAITANTAKVGISTAQASAITANTAKTGISTAQASAITANTAKNSYPTADATKLGTIETNADVTDTANVVGSLTAGTNITITAGGVISAASGGTSTTVLGTAGEIDVATVGNTATASLNTAITSAITANTAKVSVAGLNQVGAAVLSTDSVVYYAGTALAPRRKTFSLVPLSIFNNDAGFTTNTGTVTNVTGTANQINVATGTTAPVVSLNNTITNAITANTAKTGITTAQASAITANTAKVGITTAQSNAITANTAKVSVAGLTQVGGAIIASDSLLYYDNTTPRRKTFSSVPLSVFNNDAGFVTSAGDAFLANTQTFTGANTFSNAAGIRATNGIARETGGSTTNGVKFWSGTEAQYNTLGTGRDQNTVYYLTDV